MSREKFLERFRALLPVVYRLINASIFTSSENVWVREGLGKWSQNRILTTNFPRSYMSCIDAIKQTKEFEDANAAMQEYAELDAYLKACGYWGLVDEFFRKAISKGVIDDKAEGVFNFDTALTMRYLDAVIQEVESKKIRFRCESILKGIELDTGSLRIGDVDLSVFESNLSEKVLLTQQEMDEYRREHDNQIYLKIQFDVLSEWSGNSSELIFQYQNRAMGSALKTTEDIVNAIRLAQKHPIIHLKTICHHVVLPDTQYSNNNQFGVGVEKIQKSVQSSIEKSLKIVTKSCDEDEVFNRSLHRFFLSKTRGSDIDRLVDLVISLESVLLTNNKQAISNEVSYRFRLNASLLSKIFGEDPGETYQLFNNAYGVRSKLVHGAPAKELDAILKKMSVKSISECSDRLEEKYRAWIFKLEEISVDDRPYNKQGGWENLIWGNSA